VWVFITLQELELRTVRFDVVIPAGEIEYDHQFRQKSDLAAHGTAELVNQTLGEVRIRGSLSVTIETACDRCLETTEFPVAKRFELFYQPVSDYKGGGEEELEEVESEVAYYEGDQLDLNEILREVVLLALPMRMVCREDCKGICPGCGTNRNQHTCDCHAQAGDDRWRKLREIRVTSDRQN
jgi:uncharacterized protein